LVAEAQKWMENLLLESGGPELRLAVFRLRQNAAGGKPKGMGQRT
jgi:hypothetical protein